MKSGFRKLFGNTEEGGEAQELAILESASGEVTLDDGAPHVIQGQDGPAKRNGRPVDAKSADAKAVPNVRDRVVESLLEKDLVASAHVQEARNLWHRRGGKETLWRVLAQHPAVDRAVAYCRWRASSTRPAASTGSSSPRPTPRGPRRSASCTS
jgi:hypothetical protein